MVQAHTSGMRRHGSCQLRDRPNSLLLMQTITLAHPSQRPTAIHGDGKMERGVTIGPWKLARKLMAKLGRGAQAYRKLAVLICAPRPGARCWLCGELIIYGLRPRHRRGPSLDHVVPLSRGGSLLDPANCRLAHYGCNCDRKNGPPTAFAYRTDPALMRSVSNSSREW